MTGTQKGRQVLLEALEKYDVPLLKEIGRNDAGVLSRLVRLAYNKETLVGWRAIKAIGLIARETMPAQYEAFRELIRRQLWSLNDESGGIGWSAPEIIGEVVAADTARFRDIIPILADVYSIEEAVFRPGIMYAMYRIAQTDPAAASLQAKIALKGLSDPNPVVRVYALRFLREIRSSLSEAEIAECEVFLERLKNDSSEIWIYEEGTFKNLLVREEVGNFI